jgi:hypothetical protein
MKEYVALVGLDETETDELRALIDQPVIAHVTLPELLVRDGQLWMESGSRPRYVPIRKVVYHGIYEHDLDFIGGLALWNGATLPNARAMLDCRHKLTCLVKALAVTRFGAMRRGYATAYTRFDTEIERVAKWGNWHCGENKARFHETWEGDQPAIIEEFIRGQAVRVVMIGDQYWQIRLEGDDWLKSIHHATATFMDVDAGLLEDTRALQAAFGLEVIGNDYMVGDDGTRHLLEVNHIPNVTRFPEIWQAYRDYVVSWVGDIAPPHGTSEKSPLPFTL